MRYLYAYIKYIFYVFNLYVVISYFHNIHVHCNHRHLRNIDCLTVRTACLVCFISTVKDRSKKIKKRSLLRAALVVGT
jgi:hypothetical protein